MPYIRYCVNKNLNRRQHEVHKYGCAYMPKRKNRVDLGLALTCHIAVRKAKKIYRKVNGCYFCSSECDRKTPKWPRSTGIKNK